MKTVISVTAVLAFAAERHWLGFFALVCLYALVYADTRARVV